MAKQKLTKAERASWEKDLAVLRNAVAQCEATLKADDEADEDHADKAAKATDANTVKSFAGRAQGRQGTVLGVLACRELGRPGGPKQ